MYYFLYNALSGMTCFVFSFIMYISVSIHSSHLILRHLHGLIFFILVYGITILNLEIFTNFVCM